MSPTFLSSYLREVSSSVSNWHEDNYDFYRYGPQTKIKRQINWKTPFVNYLQRKGYFSLERFTLDIMKATKLVDTHIKQ
jgi:hypothetical protein